MPIVHLGSSPFGDVTWRYTRTESSLAAWLNGTCQPRVLVTDRIPPLRLKGRIVHSFPVSEASVGRLNRVPKFPRKGIVFSTRSTFRTNTDNTPKRSFRIADWSIL